MEYVIHIGHIGPLDPLGRPQLQLICHPIWHR